MGNYINEINGKKLPMRGKEISIVNQVPDSKRIQEPKALIADLVCVVNNGAFDAAAYIPNEREFEAFTDPSDNRLRCGCRCLAQKNCAISRAILTFII